MLRFKIDYKHIITEITLVTVGILIAIQIDTWYNERVEQQEIDKYLISIQEEFEIEMIWQKDNKMYFLKQQRQWLDQLSRWLINQEKDSLPWIIGYSGTLKTNYGVDFYDFPILDEFIQLDYLNKIQDDSLRLWLKEYNKIQGYAEVAWNHTVERTNNIITPFLVKNFTYMDIFDSRSEKTDAVIIPKNLRKNYEILYDNPEFLNIVALKTETVDNDIYVLEDAIESFNHILRNIKRYNKEKSPKSWNVKEEFGENNQSASTQ